MHHYGSADLVWSGNELRLHSKRGRLLATVIPDSKWPNMWRVHLPGGQPTDMVNLTRVKDAAIALVLPLLSAGQAPVGASPIDLNSEAAE